jgi:hypothetical protein
VGSCRRVLVRAGDRLRPVRPSDEEFEEVTGVVEPERERLPAVSDPAEVQRGGAAASPAVQAAAVAATGLMAGAVTVAAMRRIRTRRRPVMRRPRRSSRPAQVVASRSFLVDVHLLDRG